MTKNEDSSSSEDEITNAALKEACDEQFFSQSLFSTKNSTEPEIVKEEVKPSLRITERTDNFLNFGVSSSFKDFVAKKLDALLDKSIIDENSIESHNDHPKKKKRRKKKHKEADAGIKLLNSSDKAITKIEEPEEPKQRRIAKPWQAKLVNDEPSSTAKCQEAAVDPQSILSKEETKFWCERSRGTVFKYKRSSNGALIEQ